MHEKKRHPIPGGMMNRRISRLARVLLLSGLSLVALLGGAASAAAQRELTASLELFGSHSVVSSSLGGFTFHQESFGLRGGAQFGGPFGIEAALQRSNGDHPVYDFDLSAKYYFLQRERFGFYAVAGPGDRHEDTFLGSGTDRGTVHFGIGTEIGLGAKAYLRPEVLVRWPLTKNQDVATDRTMEYTLGFGWRF
jgi:hypothetical protein